MSPGEPCQPTRNVPTGGKEEGNRPPSIPTTDNGRRQQVEQTAMERRVVQLVTQREARASEPEPVRQGGQVAANSARDSTRLIATGGTRCVGVQWVNARSTPAGGRGAGAEGPAVGETDETAHSRRRRSRRRCPCRAVARRQTRRRGEAASPIRAPASASCHQKRGVGARVGVGYGGGAGGGGREGGSGCSVNRIA